MRSTILLCSGTGDVSVLDMIVVFRAAGCDPPDLSRKVVEAQTSINRN